MIKIMRSVARLALIALIFFSLQGEVIIRYADIFQGKTEKQAKLSQKEAQRWRLNKLQCFTQKFNPAALPNVTRFVFILIEQPVLKAGLCSRDVSFQQRSALTTPSLRGPPVKA